MDVQIHDLETEEKIPVRSWLRYLGKYGPVAMLSNYLGYPWVSTLDFSARRDRQGRSCHFCGFLKSTIWEARSKNTTRIDWSTRTKAQSEKKWHSLKVLFFSARKPTLIIVRIVVVRFDFQDRLHLEWAKIPRGDLLQTNKETVSATHIVLNVGLFRNVETFMSLQS